MNLVTCTKRTYNIQTQNGIEMEVESEKPLSREATSRLLEDDSIISTFLANVNILNIKAAQRNVIHKKPSKKIHKKRKIARLSNESGLAHEGHAISESTDQYFKPSVPYERINMMITIEGEFTRADYQKFIRDKGYKISDFMGHNDIENALMLKRIAPTGEKIGKGSRKYRIIDVMPVEEYMFRKILRNSKVKKY
jgi:hypothetical protein